jgi:hypothetical protein
MVDRSPVARFNSFFWAGGTVLFFLAEVLAVGIVVRSAGLGVWRAPFGVYILPLLVGLPWITAITSNARISKRQSVGGANQAVLLDVSYSLSRLIVITYVGLIGTMAVLGSYLRSLHLLLGAESARATFLKVQRCVFAISN